MPKVGEVLSLSMQLHDGDETKFVRATVTDDAGVAILGSPVTLTHVTKGRYQDATLVMPDTDFVGSTFEVFDDIGLTSLSPDHTLGTQAFEIDRPFVAIGECLDLIKDKLDELLEDGLVLFRDADLTAFINDDPELIATISDSQLTAVVIDEEVLTGDIDDGETIGVVLDDNELEATIKGC